MQRLLQRLWFRLNQHYCLCNAYHAQGRQDLLTQSHWERLADDWGMQLWRLERRL